MRRGPAASDRTRREASTTVVLTGEERARRPRSVRTPYIKRGHHECSTLAIVNSGQLPERILPGEDVCQPVLLTADEDPEHIRPSRAQDAVRPTSSMRLGHDRPSKTQPASRYRRPSPTARQSSRATTEPINFSAPPICRSSPAPAR